MLAATAPAASAHAFPSRARAARRAIRLGTSPPGALGSTRRHRGVASRRAVAPTAAASDERVTVIGEALWDSLPQGLFLGGAPANVACHLNELGRSPTVVSRVGDDELGREVIRRLTNRGLDVSNVQVDDTGIPTGFVVVTMEGAMPSYDIVQPSAWDAMAVTDDVIKAASGAVLVYGSLAQRDERGASAIDAASKVASKRVFDINLRKPFIDEELCVRHARECWLLKLNDDELPEMYKWCGLEGIDENDVIAMACATRDALECDNLCVTRGGDGALLVSSSGAVAQHPGFEVTAVDTVGAGDSFLATLLDSLLAGATPNAALERACRVGAFVATQQGATPAHDAEAIDELQSK
jgi:fructokinase